MNMKKAFSLLEVMIVVAILGILAAVILPDLRGHTQKAKENAAKDNLRILRNAIEVYAANHDGIAPGYPNDDTSKHPSYMSFARRMTELEHHLSGMPENPFNGIAEMRVLAESDPFPTEPAQTDIYGWVYKPATKEIRLNWPGTDSNGKPYFDY